MQPATSNQAASKKPVFWIFIFALIGLTLFIGITKYLLGNSSSDLYPEDAARDEVRVKNLADLQSENQAKLIGYAWVDRAKGKVQIPIQEAMKLVLADIGDKKPAVAYPIAGMEAAPVAPAAPAPIATPAPTASPSPAAPITSETSPKEPAAAKGKSPAKGSPKSAKPDKASKP
jgi:hypothetical protein